MRRSSSLALLAALVASTGATAQANTYAGVQALVISGVHRDCCINQYGVGGGPLIEAGSGGKRVMVHLEGIPVVAVPSRPSAEYGKATPALGIAHAAAEFAVDKASRLWLGAGVSVYNQRTPLPALQQEVSSRLSGLRYVARYREPLRGTRFLESTLGIAPTIFGTDRFLYSDGITPAVNKDERASEIDASVALGVRRGSTEWLFGVRTLNFSAHFTKDGSSADRNAGTGVLVEWRHFIRE